MLFALISSIIFNSYVTYLLGTIGIIILATFSVIEFREYQTKNECKKRNLHYVKIPSQIFSLVKKQRYDLLEIDILKQNGPVFGCLLWNEFTTYVSNPELVQTICNKEFTKFANRRQFISNDPIFDSFLFATNDDKWKRIRAIMSPTFSSGKLRKVKFCIDDTVKTMMGFLDEKIQKDPVVNCKEIIGSFTMDTIIQMAYGVKIDSLRDPNNRIIKYAKKIFGQDTPLKDTFFFTLAVICPSLVKVLGIRFQDEGFSYFEKIAKEIIVKKREELKHKTGKANNFIELILEVEQEQNEEMKNGNQTNGDVHKNGTATPNGIEQKPFKYITNDEIIGQCVTFFTVGYDTTASTITNVCYLLAKYPDKQEKLYQTIMETLDHLSKDSETATNDPHELITFDTINKFDYLNAVINESQRIYSIATATERKATEDIRLETADKKIWFDVKKGDILRFSIARMHTDPECFSNPDKFIPERFLPNSTETANKHAFIPFGTGPRNCVARSLAILEAKMAIVHLIRVYSFQIDPVKTKELDFYVNADLAICKDIKLRVEKR